MKRLLSGIGCCALVCAGSVAYSAPAIDSEVDAIYAQVEALYIELHRNPELSSHEAQTAARLATGLRELGYEVWRAHADAAHRRDRTVKVRRRDEGWYAVTLSSLPLFAPDREKTIKAAVAAEVTSLRELMPAMRAGGQ